MSEFPTIVYRTPGPYRGPKGATYDYRGIADQSALQDALGDGWHLTLPDAIAGVQARAVVAEMAEAQEAIEAITEETREALEAKAKALGVSFNSRTSDATLIQRIAAA